MEGIVQMVETSPFSRPTPSRCCLTLLQLCQAHCRVPLPFSKAVWWLGAQAVQPDLWGLAGSCAFLGLSRLICKVGMMMSLSAGFAGWIESN